MSYRICSELNYMLFYDVLYNANIFTINKNYFHIMYSVIYVLLLIFILFFYIYFFL